MPTATGKKWTVTALRKILTSARISGRRENVTEKSAGVTRKGKARRRRLRVGTITCDKADWPAIITASQSDALRVKYAQSSPAPVRNHLLSYIATCGVCGGLLSAMGSLRGMRRIGCRQCGKVAALADPFEQVVEQLVREQVADGALVPFTGHQHDEALSQAQAELTRVEADLTRLADRRGRGEIDDDEWDAARAPLKGRQKDLKKKLASALAAAQKAKLGFEIDNPLDVGWETRSLAHKRTLIKLLFSEVRLMPGVRGRHGFNPDRIRLTVRMPDSSAP
jgi:hypothetical protein